MANVAAPFQNPFGAPTVSGALITVDQALNQPTVITRRLADLTLRGYFGDKIFANGGGVSGGAVVYTQLTANDLFLTRDVQNVEPGGEFPIVTEDRPTPLVAQVEKFGGKFFVTDEARLRNDPTLLQQGLVKLGNNIARKMNDKAIAVLDASVTATSSTFAGHSWSSVVTAGSSASTSSVYPAADLAKAQLLADQQELGVTYDTWIMNPAELVSLRLVYGAQYLQVLESFGITVVTSNRVTAGTAYVVAAGQVGQVRFERPLATETWREQATERTWVQSGISPVWAVTNPFSVVKVTGLS
jgi:hypothetical protein